MSTNTYYPRILNQVGSFNDITNTPSIDWNFENPSFPQTVITVKPLYTISGFWQEIFRSVTSDLWYTDLQIPDSGATIVGIELDLEMQRNARVQDLTVQLTYNGALIGENQASAINPVQSNMYTGENTVTPIPAGNMHTYGASDSVWGTTDLTTAMLSDSSFGVVIGFQSNHIYPHSDFAQVNRVALRITYA
jgi:hypothetical protein